MTDYTTLKVPELKKLLSDRSLPSTGNKPDLIARLQEDDKKKASAPAAAPVAADDEIDWDEDDKPTTEPAVAAVAAGGQGAVANPVAVPNQTLSEDPAKTHDLTVKGGANAPVAADGVVASAGETSTTEAPAAADAKSAADAEPAVPAVDFSIGIKQSDAEKEAEKRAARAKRFGLSVSEEEEKKAERAKKFGIEEKKEVVKGLDDALPERRAKRGREGREGREGRDGGRDAKRQATNGRNGGAQKGKGGKQPVENKPAPKPAKPAGKILDDPSEKAKAEARAKRFATAT